MIDIHDQHNFNNFKNHNKQLLSLVSSYLETKDIAIATFLVVKQLELIWLVRVLLVEYDKQLPTPTSFQQKVIENITRSIFLTIDETDVLNYGQQNKHNIVYNILKTKLSSTSSDNYDLSSNNDDIIFLDRSKSYMDILQNYDAFHIDFSFHHQLSMP